MQLSQDQIKSFQDIFEKRFNRKIDEKEAYERGIKLLRLVELTYRPMTEKEFKELEKRREETKK